MMQNALFYCGTLGIGSARALPLAGYGRRSEALPSDTCGLEANWVVTGAHDNLIVLVAIDALFGSDLLEQSIQDALKAQGFEMRHCMIVASHTHFAPALDPEKPNLGSADHAHITQVGGNIGNAVAAHITQKKEQHISSWSWGKTQNTQSIFRRAKRFQLSYKSWPFARIAMQIAPNPKVAINQDLRIWIAQADDNAPLFALVSWPCHATSRSDIRKPSPDFIGALRRALRTNLGTDIPILYFPGASSDIRPNMTRLRSLKKRLYPYPFQSSFAPPSPQEEAIFDASLQASVNQILSSNLQTLNFENTEISNAVIPLSKVLTSADTKTMMISSLTIGGVKIIGVGAEISSAWPELLGIGLQSDREILSGCVGSVFGYLPTDAQIPEGGYEVTGFRNGFGVKGRYIQSKEIAPVLRTALQEADLKERTPLPQLKTKFSQSRPSIGT